MSKKKIIFIIISALILITVCVSVGISGVLSPYERQVRLGYKLLEEGKYEESILAFDKAIEIDVKRDKAYIGKADVYVTRCDENTLEDTKKVIGIGYAQHYDDEAFVSTIIRLADELYAKEKRSWAIELLDFGYELTNDEKVKDKKEQIINELSKKFLGKLFTMFEQGDEDAVKKEIQSEEFFELVSFVDNNKYKYIYFPEQNDQQSGRGIALYYVKSSIFGNIFVYYGDYVNGIRSGQGTWVGANGEKYYWFEGLWSNDTPNGNGKVVEYFTTDNKDWNMAYKFETTGSYVNGLLDGDFTEKNYLVDGSIISFDNATANNGILVNKGCGNHPNNEDGEYCAFVGKNIISGDEVHWMSKGELNGIIGFYDEQE